ncbi:hypothetical protein ACFV1L_34995 [Kitasatospora sp. NPDC059646]|uniref:hypothetical protein n=1 Tax=Kitasatospora sp. NPDC059646 TaxID=3346893 RepID=UPI0036AF121F
MKDRRIPRIHRPGAAATAAIAVILLGSGCTPGSGAGRADAGAATSSGAAGAATGGTASAGASAAPGGAEAFSGAEAFCRALVTGQDIPAGFNSSPTRTGCENDPKFHTVSFRGKGGGLEMLDEMLERDETAEEAATRLPELIGELNKLIGEPPEQDSTPFRDLGDEVHYFTSLAAKTHWNTLYIRRGRLLVYLSVTKLTPFSAADMHQFAAKAVARASGLT